MLKTVKTGFLKYTKYQGYINITVNKISASSQE
jgi:hypothetical protein